MKAAGGQPGPREAGLGVSVPQRWPHYRGLGTSLPHSARLAQPCRSPLGARCPGCGHGAELLGAGTWVLVLPQAVGSVLSPCPAPSTARITWAAALKPARVSPRCLSPELLTHSVPLINYLPPGGFSTFLNKYALGRAGRSGASPLGVAATGAGSVLGGTGASFRLQWAPGRVLGHCCHPRGAVVGAEAVPRAA